ncbi:hypothetical protein AVEN_54615-1 [Araneus ventricosus]|uniref:Uncharacterized protein n=1 Tax=Araneus ventricosus TaxID=182803 RepID=A0A4Y2BL77_ARAVE|nr:hypothetical protein AVEN_54615-1 [Araneus ventricosus]
MPLWIGVGKKTKHGMLPFTTQKEPNPPALSMISLVNAVNILTLEFESVLDTGKIGEEDYNIVAIEARDSTQSSHLRSAERKRFLTL